MFEESLYVRQEIVVSLQKADVESLGGDVGKWIETARPPSSTRGCLRADHLMEVVVRSCIDGTLDDRTSEGPVFSTFLIKDI